MTANPAEHERASAHTEDRHGDVPADTFAIRLVLVRHHAGRLSIEQAAKRCGLSPGNWAHWEDGRRPRDREDVCLAISDALNIDFDWLFWGGPLEGARGRPVRPVTIRPGTDTLQYSPMAVRPSPTRPMAGRPKGRTDRRNPNTGRPVVIDHPGVDIGNRLANAG